MTNNSIQLLIVEDNHADRELIEIRLASVDSFRHEIAFATTLSHASDLVMKLRPDVVLLDLSLPDSDGIEACTTIRSLSDELPIVVLTGLDDEDVAIDALQNGAQDYLVKGQIDGPLLAKSLRYAMERQRIETALKRANEELDMRVQQRTSELQQANVELRREMREREEAEELARRQREELAHLSRLNTLGEMATNLAHELNQPLTAIVAYTRGCLRRLRNDDADIDFVISDLEKAANEAKRGGEIIKRLRRYVSKREVETIPTDLNDAVQTVAAVVQYAAQRNGIAVKVELAPKIPTVMTDKVQVEQVLLNLLNNAIEATATNKQTEITIRTEFDERINIYVIDSGGGAQQDIDTLFDAFYTTKQAGLGLGLSISRSIVETLSGKLTLRGNENGGLTAILSLPIS